MLISEVRFMDDGRCATLFWHHLNFNTTALQIIHPILTNFSAANDHRVYGVSAVHQYADNWEKKTNGSDCHMYLNVARSSLKTKLILIIFASYYIHKDLEAGTPLTSIIIVFRSGLLHLVPRLKFSGEDKAYQAEDEVKRNSKHLFYVNFYKNTNVNNSTDCHCVWHFARTKNQSQELRQISKARSKSQNSNNLSNCSVRKLGLIGLKLVRDIAASSDNIDRHINFNNDRYPHFATVSPTIFISQSWLLTQDSQFNPWDVISVNVGSNFRLFICYLRTFNIINVSSPLFTALRQDHKITNRRSCRSVGVGAHKL